MTWSALLLAIAVGIITDEFLCWSQRLAEVLLRLSTHKLPPELCSRMHEEWLADLQTFPSKLSKLFFALDTFRAAYIIDHQQRLPEVSPIVPIVIRTRDLSMSLAIVLFSLPILVIVAILIFLATKGHGPVIFRDKRVGRDGKIFCLYKFRTVDLQKNLWARFVRATCFDELPVILNVLKGDMSFVGPRPERPEFVRTMSEAIPNYGQRHRVRPGMTGCAQIHYPFGSTVDDAKAECAYDVEYIDRHYTLRANLRIMLETSLIILGIKKR
ncbi:MAG: sugar transferase [Sulfuricaulis sp.]|nr:sugar transferase [Sulfuricaulis sp.]